MPEIFIYQIHYAGNQTLDPGFRVLDNSASERPDWYEYWPIRNFLLNERLQEDSVYGFLSPRFKAKTNLSSPAVFDFIKKNSTADVILMTPSLHLTAYYWNVFQYGEACHPGLLNLAAQFFERIGQPANLIDLVTHSRNEVYSNYLFAKPAFWRAWLAITEQLITIADSKTDPLGAELRKTTSYRGSHSVQMKIFIMERIPTWMLVRDATFAVVARDAFVVRSRVYKVPGAIVCDALKIAYAEHGRQPQYRDIFTLVSKMAKVLALQIRFGNLVGFKAVRSCIGSLASYWAKAGKPEQ